MPGVRAAGGGVMGEWSWTVELLREPVVLAIIVVAGVAGLVLSKMK